MTDETTTPDPTPSDWWTIWKFRLANVLGFILIAREAFLPRDEGAQPSWPILLIGVALILGAAGLQFIVKGGK